MINGYYYYDTTPAMGYVSMAAGLAIVAAVAAVIGVILFFTFCKKSNEKKYTGTKAKIYHLLNFNRFYVEDILRFLYVVVTCVITVVGIAAIVMGSFFMGIALLVGVNLVTRIGFELVMMFIILCRKTVTIDRKLDRISAFYEDTFDEDFDEDCDEDCGTCVADCANRTESPACDDWDDCDDSTDTDCADNADGSAPEEESN